MNPEFLTLAEVLDLHERALALHGGQAGIRDQGLLESALAQPESTMFGVFLHADLWEQAAAYAFHIAENQPFIEPRGSAPDHGAPQVLLKQELCVIAHVSNATRPNRSIPNGFCPIGYEEPLKVAHASNC